MKSSLSLVVVGALVFGVLLYVFGQVVPPGMLGVRQITFGPGQGFSAKGLKPGYHFVLPSYSMIHLVPRTAQVLHMHREQEDQVESSGALEIQTADRATIDVDISVVSRFYDRPSDQHGGPADLLQKIGITANRWENHIRRTVDDNLKRTLGKLKTGDFYKPDAREEQLVEATKNINLALAKDGILVEAVLLRRYTYRADRIDNAIFQKNLQVQEERLNEAASDLAKAQADLEQVAAELDAQIQTKLVQGESKAKVVRSEGDLYESGRNAQADLALAKAKAEVDRLKANALTQSAGASVFVAREMAPLLSSLKGGVVQDIDPFDVNKWARRLGAGK
jgi:regulator of protease activity HflC (stomatin/prohibitin superfamily)